LREFCVSDVVRQKKSVQNEATLPIAHNFFLVFLITFCCSTKFSQRQMTAFFCSCNHGHSTKSNQLL
jgi:hypothetical protein